MVENKTKLYLHYVRIAVIHLCQNMETDILSDYLSTTILMTLFQP